MAYTLLLGILISILPIAELRGGIPFLIANGVDPLLAFLVCTAANIIVIPLAFVFLDYSHSGLLHFSAYKKTFAFFLQRVHKKEKQMKVGMERYGLLALAIFVAIPLPGTGAYTGVLIAWMLGIEKKKAAAFIAAGVLVAGIIVTLASLGIITFLKFF